MPRYNDLFGDLHRDFGPRQPRGPRRAQPMRRPAVEPVPSRVATPEPMAPVPIAPGRIAPGRIAPERIAPERGDEDPAAASQPAAAEVVTDRNTTEKLRARFEREAERTIAIEKRHLLVDMLEVLDDLDRALEASHTGDASSVGHGVELVRERFLAKLAKHGVTRVDALDAAFDPARHEAVSAIPVDDEARHGRVLQVVRAGYAIGDEVLRPASVIVGRVSA